VVRPSVADPVIRIFDPFACPTNWKEADPTFPSEWQCARPTRPSASARRCWPVSGKLVALADSGGQFMEIALDPTVPLTMNASGLSSRNATVTLIFWLP